MNLDKILYTLVLEAMEGTDLFLVDIKPNASGTKFRILIDGDAGVSISQCVKVSRYISSAIDAMELPETPFTYEVSSPGADAPFKMLRQYAKHIGRTLEISTTDDKIHTGILQSVDEMQVTLAPEPLKGHAKKKKDVPEGPWAIPHSDIKESKVVLKFK